MGSTRPRPFATLIAGALAAPIAVLAASGGALPASAVPPTIVVDEWADELNADGDCSLREAVETLNGALAVDACAVPAAAVIEIPGPLEVLGATLTVSETMTIRGTSALPASISCSGVAGDCIDNVGPGAQLGLENLWISMAAGHQVYVAPGAGGVALSDVNVWGGGAGVVSQGGPISIAHSTVWDTTGWGVFSLTGDVTIDHATIGGHDGGAVYVDLADLTVSSSAIYDNEGYAVFGQSGSIEVVNTTIAGNGADASRTDTGTVTIRSSTVVGNRRAAVVAGAGESRFLSSVVADSALGNCADPVVSDGFNVSDDDTCAFDQPTDRTGIDPMLGAFDTSTSTPSLRPLDASPLVDSGGGCPIVDQLDAPRPTDGDGDGDARCDVGAVEIPGVPAGPDPTDPSDPDDPSAPTGQSPPAAGPATPVAARPTFTG